MEPDIEFISSKRVPRLGVEKSAAERLDPESIWRAFGARSAGVADRLDLLSVREAMTRMLASAGGRPSIEGATAQVKIPRTDVDWEKLALIRDQLEASPHKPSITQTAAVILNMALSHFSVQDIQQAVSTKVR